MRAALLGLLLLLTSAPAASAADAASEAHYRTLLAAAKTGTAPVDWQALRFAYADSAEFDVVGAKTDAARKAMFDAFNGGDYKGALAQANIILDQDYVDIDAHVVATVADGQLGDADAAQREHDIVAGLLRSIATGDGSTPANAFTVISVGEEYAAMRAFDFKVTKQALVSNGGHSYDLLAVVDSDGKAHDIYFLIDRVLAAEAAATTPQP